MLGTLKIRARSVRSTEGSSNPKVAIVCHIWSNYREAVGRKLVESKSVTFHIFASGEDLQGVRHANIDDWPSFRRSKYRYFGRALWQSDAVKLALSNEYDAIILLGDPNFVSTWVAAAIARLRNLPCLFWTHGWLREERGPRRIIRNAFYGLADKLLLYADRGRALGLASGFASFKLHPIYNSLDTEHADEIVRRLKEGNPNRNDPRTLFTCSDQPLLICTGRLTEKVDTAVLLSAATELKRRSFPVNILLVGDGPERHKLEAQAKKDALSVVFTGECYDEDIVGPYIYGSDLTVSPGKIGLTAMHTLMYGTPAITHGDMNNQMPEAEAIVEGVTGSFFKRGDHVDLANTIQSWLVNHPDREEVRRAALNQISSKWTPSHQAALIQEAVLEVINVKTA